MATVESELDRALRCLREGGLVRLTRVETFDAGDARLAASVRVSCTPAPVPDPANAVRVPVGFQISPNDDAQTQLLDAGAEDERLSDTAMALLVRIVRQSVDTAAPVSGDDLAPARELIEMHCFEGEILEGATRGSVRATALGLATVRAHHARRLQD